MVFFFLCLSFCPVLVRRPNESSFKPECSSINLLTVQHYPLNSHQGLQISCKTIFCQIEAVNGSKVVAYLGHLLSIKHSKLRKADLWQTKWYFSCLEELYLDLCFQCGLWKELFFFILLFCETHFAVTFVIVWVGSLLPFQPCNYRDLAKPNSVMLKTCSEAWTIHTFKERSVY